MTTPVAIVGMAALFPEAASLRAYWQNIVEKRDSIVDVPASRWSLADYYDPDPSAPDKTYGNRGGFIPDLDFDPVEFGLPPNLLDVTDTSQLLGLVVAKQALADAGYGQDGGRPFDRERGGVILGVAVGQKLMASLGARLEYPVWERALRSSGLSEQDTRRIVEKIKLAYAPWEEASFPGLLGNVVAGRIANRLDLGGTNCTIDAACASSLAAVKMAIGELTDHQADLMITGGVDTDNSPLMYTCFSKTPAISPRGSSRPFDADADGMLVGEGIGMLVLKRLADAERDGDRIYAVIRGVGSSSDGRYRSIYAPRGEGQARALNRAYQQAGLSPASVGLIEAHGTGTAAGDLVEATTLVSVLTDAEVEQQRVALGSVKSQIGHTKAAAGAAGLIKAALALHQKVLPPTINVSRPHPEYRLEGSPLFLNTETSPWLRAAPDQPRRAGVSSFGFGGTNFHVVLEEHEAEPRGSYRLQAVARPILLAADTPERLLERCRALAGQIEADTDETFAQLGAASVEDLAPDAARLGFVAGSPAEAGKLLGLAADTLARRIADEDWDHPGGVFYRRRALDLRGRVVALFAGQGSQYVGMGRALACTTPAVRAAFERMDARFLADGRSRLSEIVFPPPAFETADQEAQARALERTEYAQPAIGAFSVGLFQVLREHGFQPDFAAGHSFGELTALWAAGAFDDETYAALARARGAAMAPPDRPNFDAGGMLAVSEAAVEHLERTGALGGLTVANVNAPGQIVLAGPLAQVAAAERHLAAAGLNGRRLPVSAAFHTPLVEHAAAPFAAALAGAIVRSPRIPVYANATAEPYPMDPETIGAALAEQIVRPVQFQRQIERLADAGGYLFVEFGPRNVLTSLADKILADRPHLAIAVNASRAKDDDRQLREAIVRLRVAGLPLSGHDPYQHVPATTDRRKPSPATVRLNGSNYVSDARRRAFEAALNDGHRVGASEQPPEPAGPHLEPGSAVERTNGTHTGHGIAERTNGAYQNGVANGHTAAKWSEPGPPDHPLTSAAPPPLADASLPALDGLDPALEQFARQQSEALQAHQQYLAYQADHARSYGELAQQQQEWLLGADHAALPPAVLDTLSHGLTLFHQHQQETARVHAQYLEYQAGVSASLYELIARRYGDSTTAPLPAPARRQPAPAPAVSTTPIVSKLPAAPPPDLAPYTAAQSTVAAAPLPALAPAAPVPAESEVTPAHGRAADFETIGAALLEVVCDKTGYPIETLDVAMDMESDLGIDSIKRVEILGAMSARFPEAGRLRPADLAELRTLAQVIEYLHVQAGGVPGRTAEAEIATPPHADAARPPLESGPVPERRSAAVPQAVVHLKRLPPPDRLDLSLPPGAHCLLTDDRTPLTTLVAGQLQRLGWRVTILEMPDDEPALERALADAARQSGPVGAFVHLHPRAPAEPGLAGLFPDADRVAVKQVFLLAKHLGRPLVEAAAYGLSAFLVVTRLDGELGLAGRSDASAVAGGLFGLVKTLRQEWPAVFCRAVDVQPEIAAEQAAALILGELQDPNRLVVEVGHGERGRVTLAAGEPLVGTGDRA